MWSGTKTAENRFYTYLRLLSQLVNIICNSKGCEGHIHSRVFTNYQALCAMNTALNIDSNNNLRLIKLNQNNFLRYFFTNRMKHEYIITYLRPTSSSLNGFLVEAVQSVRKHKSRPARFQAVSFVIHMEIFSSTTVRYWIDWTPRSEESSAHLVYFIIVYSIFIMCQEYYYLPFSSANRARNLERH